MTKQQEAELKLITALEVYGYEANKDYAVEDFQLTGDEEDEDILWIASDYNNDVHTEKCENQRDTKDSEFFDDKMEMF